MRRARNVGPQRCSDSQAPTLICFAATHSPNSLVFAARLTTYTSCSHVSCREGTSFSGIQSECVIRVSDSRIRSSHPVRRHRSFAAAEKETQSVTECLKVWPAREDVARGGRGRDRTSSQLTRLVLSISKQFCGPLAEGRRYDYARLPRHHRYTICSRSLGGRRFGSDVSKTAIWSSRVSHDVGKL